MQLVEVTDAKTWKWFHKVPHTVYANTPDYIFPLEKDIEAIFTPASNKLFTHGEAKLWVLLADGVPSGRLAAFIDHDKNKSVAYPIGGIGFFECIQHEGAATLLFEQAERYLHNLGAFLIEGPINFGERDKFWGLLVKGFHTALFQENYHPPYYLSLFEKAGYRPYEQSLTYKGTTKELPLERLAAVAKRLKGRVPVEIKTIDLKNTRQFANDFCIVYNASFQKFDHFRPLQEHQIEMAMQQAKPIADPNLACIAYYEGHPAGFVVLFPDINPYLQHAKGKLNWMTIPGFLLRKRLAKAHRAKGIGFGVHPDYESKGIFAFLVDFMATPETITKYPLMFLAGVRTHNHAIRQIYAKIGVEVHQIHISLRKHLKEGIPFEPFEFLP